MKLTFLVSLCSLSVLAYPNLRKLGAVEDCTPDNCKIEENCRCLSVGNPIPDVISAPQLVAITFNEAISQTNYDNYFKPLLFDQTNHDGSPVGATFYVPHESTDYSLVQDLYVRGYEIGSFSITRNSNISYWETASRRTLGDEFGGQKTIISTFANVPGSDITGARTPSFALNGDESIYAYQSSGFTYDCSWTSYPHYLPFTLDHETIEVCYPDDCPWDSHPGFWETSIIPFTGMDAQKCNYFSECLMVGTPVEISNWLYGQIRMTNKAPLILLLDLKWFQTVENSFEAFALFLERLKTVDDVFFVSVQDILEWMHNPVATADYKVPDHSDRAADCLAVNCGLRDEDGQTRYMKSCVACPKVYPWIGNPLGQ